MRMIQDVAQDLGVSNDHLEYYGRYKAKIAPESLQGRPPRGKLVLVSAITPTPAGEGKTTTTIGLTQALVQRKIRAAAALREPSLGPYLGMKGGGTGGGRSQIEPATDINLHFTGDKHAVSSAHNLLAAVLDNHLHHDNSLGIDSRKVLWRRVVDMNDRALRQIIVGLGGHKEGIPRETGFDITAASEVMAILCLAKNRTDLKERLGRIVVGFRRDGSPVTANDLKVVGAMAALLKDAVKPNLVQTTEGAPAIVHGGPFANIAHGTSSIAATQVGLAYADMVITEAGFAFELGAEKFFDIHCQYGGFAPSCTVLVSTVRALKMHGGVNQSDLNTPNPGAIDRGFANLEKHLENIRKFEQECVVAINRFPQDTAEEIQHVQKLCEKLGIRAVAASPFLEGGEGCLALADAVRELVEKCTPHFRPVYSWTDRITDKISAVAKAMYGAQAVDYQARAKRDVEQLEKLGYGHLPVCIAKTQQSLSDNPALLGRPKDFLVTVREIKLAAGAGFVVPITGDIMRMPGLPKVPLAERFDLNDAGEIVL